MDSMMDDFKTYMPYYQQFIDDGIGIWLLGEPNADSKFNEFFSKLKRMGKNLLDLHRIHGLTTIHRSYCEHRQEQHFAL